MKITPDKFHTLTIKLPPEQRARFIFAARCSGLPLARWMLDTCDAAIPPEILQSLEAKRRENNTF